MKTFLLEWVSLLKLNGGTLLLTFQILFTGFWLHITTWWRSSKRVLASTSELQCLASPISNYPTEGVFDREKSCNSSQRNGAFVVTERRWSRFKTDISSGCELRANGNFWLIAWHPIHRIILTNFSVFFFFLQDLCLARTSSYHRNRPNTTCRRQVCSERRERRHFLFFIGKAPAELMGAEVTDGEEPK